MWRLRSDDKVFVILTKNSVASGQRGVRRLTCIEFEGGSSSCLKGGLRTQEHLPSWAQRPGIERDWQHHGYGYSGQIVNLPLFTSGNLATGTLMYPGLPSGRNNPVVQLSDTLTWVRGKHTMTMGGAYMNTNKNKEAADELEKYLKLEVNTQALPKEGTPVKLVIEVPGK